MSFLLYVYTCLIHLALRISLFLLFPLTGLSLHSRNLQQELLQQPWKMLLKYRTNKNTWLEVFFLFGSNFCFFYLLKESVEQT